MIEREKYRPPDNAVEALARCLYPMIRSYFESEEGQREFAEWKSSQGTEKSAKGSDEQEDSISNEVA